LAFTAVMVCKLIVAALFALPTALVEGAMDPRPNVLNCLADDWGWPNAGVYGDRVVDMA